MASEIWSTIHQEREALAADLKGVDEAAWATPSMCDRWTVRDVVAHMTATVKITPLAFFPKLAASGFGLERMQEKDIARERGASTSDTLAGFEAQVGSSKHPPGPTPTWLGEVIVHGEDVRRPLGIAHDYPMDAVVTVADSYKGSNLIIGAKKRLAGLKLIATDTDWQHGDGAAVSGPMVALLLAMTGRKPVLDDLEGDGVAILRGR